MLNEDNLELLVQGMEGVTIRRFEVGETFMRAEVEPLPLPDDTSPEIDAMYRNVVELANKAIEITQPQAVPGFQQMVSNTPEPMRLVYLLGSMLSLDVQKEQSLLEANSRHEALELLLGYLTREVQVLELRQKIATQAQSEITMKSRVYAAAVLPFRMNSARRT